METFIAVYRGKSIKTARFVDACAVPAVVRQVAAILVDHYENGGTLPDPVLKPLDEGARAALVAIRDTTGMEGG